MVITRSHKIAAAITWLDQIKHDTEVNMEWSDPKMNVYFQVRDLVMELENPCNNKDGD